MQIDRENGVVVLPNGVTISPTLTQDAFCALPAGRESQSQDYGTLPWIHYRLSGGDIDDKEILVSLCFYDQMLVRASLTANHYPPGPRNWSSYSLEVEAAIKHFHDRLLEKLLGRPSKGPSFLLHRLPEGEGTLSRPLEWRFPWGKLCSTHDSKGGGTFIRVSYGNRYQEASELYVQQNAQR